MIDWTKAKSPQADKTTKNIKNLLDHLGNPQDQIATIHIGGTNGKGSIQAFLESIFVQAGYKTGIFTSPYLWDIKDSIRINKSNIGQKDFDNQLAIIEEASKKYDIELSEFEILTALTFNFFKDQDLDMAIIETGLGGRDDATNVIKNPSAIAFGNISMDHTNILGEDIQEIAAIKADIIRPQSKVFSLPQDKEVKKVLDSKGRINYLDPEKITNIKTSASGASFYYKRKSYKIQMPGEHQVHNSALALEITDNLETEFPKIKTGQEPGLDQAFLPARLETLQIQPRLIIDGAHNPASLDALIKYLEDLRYDRLILGFGILRDKGYDYFIDILFPLADQIVLTSIDNPRNLDPVILYDSLDDDLKERTHVEKDLKKALYITQNLASNEDLILWCGSFYLIKDIKHLILGK